MGFLISQGGQVFADSNLPERDVDVAFDTHPQSKREKGMSNLERDADWIIVDDTGLINDPALPATTCDVQIGRTWQAIGPFPSGTREHTFLSSPLAAFEETSSDKKVAFLTYDPSNSWPSALATGGQVSWQSFETRQDGWTNVEYPHIRWAQLRHDQGWAALQYQTVARTSLTVRSSSVHNSDQHRPILMELLAGSEFAVVSASAPEDDAIWYNGDIYSYAREGLHATEGPSTFAHHLQLQPGDYILLVRAQYEIRLFGDPGLEGPVIRFKMAAGMDTTQETSSKPTCVAVPEFHLVPDLVDGRLMGRYCGIGLRLLTGDGPSFDMWTLTGATASSEAVSVKGFGDWTISPGPIAVLPVILEQAQPIAATVDALTLELTLTSSDGQQVHIHATLGLRHHGQQSCKSFKFTHIDAPEDKGRSCPALVSYAIAIPPTTSDYKGPDPTVLALHGAGVEASAQEWIDAIPRRCKGWAVLPTGRTSWGEDWHGGSMFDAWAARDALAPILCDAGSVWRGAPLSDKTIIMGHSNGGQGAWHLASHWPDRVLGVVAAAGYSKIQDYVPYTSWTSNHYADPALMGILQSALAPYNNDLYMSNLTDTPILAVHGADDDNVPPHHSRLQAGLVQSHKQSVLDVQLLEVPGKKHWWPQVLKSQEVVTFLNALAKRDSKMTLHTNLVTYAPSETGSKNGFRILQQKVQGSRSSILAYPDDCGLETPPTLVIKTCNVLRFAFQKSSAQLAALFGQITVDGHVFEALSATDLIFSRPKDCTAELTWSIVRPAVPLGRIAGSAAVTADDTSSSQRRHSPYFAEQNVSMAAVLSGRHRFQVVFDFSDTQCCSRALRLQHDLFLYHRVQATLIDVRLFRSMSPLEISPGNYLHLGAALGAHNQQHGPREPHGWISLAAHPLHGNIFCTAEPDRQYSVIFGASPGRDDLQEKALRLFPLRTGVPLPSYLLAGSDEWQGAGSFLAAGFGLGTPRESGGLSWRHDP